jgi:5-methylcytosine-specific restriction endonuclease McrA
MQDAVLPKRVPLSKQQQVSIFRRDKWLCHLCSRPVIFGPVMRLLERDVRKSSFGGRRPLAYYHAHATRDGAPLLDELWAVLDHVQPRSKGGLNDETNLATACNKCNGRKSDAAWKEYIERMKRKPVKGKYGEPLHWDGLSTLFVVLAQRDPVGLSASEREWLKALT